VSGADDLLKVAGAEAQVLADEGAGHLTRGGALAQPGFRNLEQGGSLLGGEHLHRRVRSRITPLARACRVLTLVLVRGRRCRAASRVCAACSSGISCPYRGSVFSAAACRRRGPSLRACVHMRLLRVSRRPGGRRLRYVGAARQRGPTGIFPAPVVEPGRHRYQYQLHAMPHRDGVEEVTAVAHAGEPVREQVGDVEVVGYPGQVSLFFECGSHTHVQACGAGAQRSDRKPPPEVGRAGCWVIVVPSCPWYWRPFVQSWTGSVMRDHLHFRSCLGAGHGRRAAGIPATAPPVPGVGRRRPGAGTNGGGSRHLRAACRSRRSRWCGAARQYRGPRPRRRGLFRAVRPSRRRSAPGSPDRPGRASRCCGGG